MFNVNGWLANSPMIVPTSKDETIGAFNRGNGQKVPMFFNPISKKRDEELETKVTHEAKTLTALENHVAEVAVSFDEPLTYAEIQEKIPKDLLINWYWIGTDSDLLDALDLLDHTIGINADENGKLTASLKAEEWVSYDYSSFVSAVKQATKTQGAIIGSVDIYKDARKQVEKYPTLKTAKFAGVIVSGRTENLAKLDEESYVYATNVGLETEILPYLMPTK
ncbi:hypothetical protein Hs30E_20780 [Lactococcus hodotermopsidis]|uniref:Sigma factor regulator C-terminal domain-containing protein n=1 Tax=Pseudolactococcus hodotermopsidis TaxID=2709157 RepID=A0A6A0BDJ2_9LACT|nr:anti sigma factor C-terminal domain-containing protein [Lactococcus hodotermopsidis]GFH43482.1 hypothetical protein Hs30E_20780 [Lactococcus hodotermopsidis]